MGVRDEDREINLVDELTILPDQTRDDTDEGWSMPSRRSRISMEDQRLLDERPPHWG